MIPDILLTSSKEHKKVYWMILWWVEEKYNSNVLSTYIYNEALRLIGGQAIIKSYTENVSSFYKKMPFEVIQSRLRYTIFFSLDKSTLFAKFKFLKYFKWSIIILDKISGASLRYINLSKINKKSKNIAYEYLNQLDNQAWQFIEPLCCNDIILKTKDYVNWQISPLQYTNTPIEIKHPYLALESGISNNISIYNIKVLKGKTVIGFLSFLINYNELNVKYF